MEWNGPIGKKQSDQVIYCGFRMKDLWWWTRRYVWPEDTLSETHSARTEKPRPAYTRILAVGPIPVSDKTTFIWCACKNKDNNESRYSIPINPHDRLSRDNEDRSRYFIDLYRGSWCLVAVGGAKNSRAYARTEHGVEAKTRGWWSKDHLDVDSYDSFRTMWLGEVCGYYNYRQLSARWCARCISIIDP